MSSVEPRVHGGLADAELAALGLRADDVLDVSVNVNPYGPSAAVVDAIRAARFDRYPDPTAHAAREAIAAALGTRASRVVLGNGAVDVLWTLVRTVLSPGEAALVVEPAFSEFAAAVRAAGGRVATWRAQERVQFQADLPRVFEAARESHARLLYLCSPANPSGAPLAVEEVTALAAAHPDLVVVLDESFLGLSERFADARQPTADNVVRVRSMTKEHAVPGVRVGYLLAPDDLAARIESARPPWTTSAFAQAVAVCAAREGAFVERSRLLVLEDRRRLTDALRRAGHHPVPTSTFFLLLPVLDGASTRARLLARHRVLVRDCASFGLPGFVRLCAQPPGGQERLLAALREEPPR